MSQDDLNPLHEGFIFPSLQTVVTEAAQREKLACCQVDPAVFGNRADITAFAMESIMATKRAGVSINGSVHVGQYFDLREPIDLGEQLTLQGKVTKVEPEPRGHLITSTFELERNDGTVPLVLERTSLRISAQSETKGPLGRRQASEPDHGDMRLEAKKQLEPDKVAQYSIEAENLIHSDPAVARQFGFKAPIAGGLMAVRMMMESLVQGGPIETLKMSVRFKRPMFWDEMLEIYSYPHEGEDRPGRYAICRPDGKVVNDAVVHELTRG